MSETRWPRCTSCGSRLPEGAPGTPVTRPLPPPPVEFTRILESHMTTARTAGYTPLALVISHVEAGRCGIRDVTEILGIPVVLDDLVPLGSVRLRLGNTTGRYVRAWEFLVPAYFTED